MEGLGQIVQKEVLALDVDENRHPQFLFEASHEPEEHRVGDVDDIGLEVCRQPGDELLELLGLRPLLSLEDRQRQGPELAGVGRAGKTLRDPGQKPRPVEDPVKRPRRVTKESALLLQVDVEGAVENPRAADALLVGSHRRVGRQQRHLVAQLSEGRRQRVVVDAATAIHAGSAGSDVGDSHERLVLGLR